MNKLLEQFYIENRALLLKRLYHRAGSAENAEDILQESFSRALKYGNSFNPNTQELGAWFNTIMNNALKSFKRDERSMGTYVEYEEELSESYEMSQTDGDLVERIKGEIELEPNPAKDILYLYFVKEYRPREIREVLDIPYKTMENVLTRFKSEMRYKFGD